VKRAAPGGEGWMLNPLYPQAMTNWLSWFDAALKNYSGVKPLAVFQDSYEYRTDWSPDFFAQFEKRRGYKLQNELPSLFGTNLDEQTMRVKYDYRRTVSEIMAGESEPAWIAWAHQNGFQTIYQAHGTPANWLDLYADADMPETEMFRNDRSILISKFASSAAHVAGKKFVGAETGTWLKEHFTGTLADLKYLADDMFLAGVNRIFYHGACYSPADAPWPGWLFYASTEMNPRNPIWRDVPALNNYIARVQSVLQSGQPDNDILLYWPVADFWSAPDGWLQPMAVGKTDWFEKQPIGRVAHELWDRGYAFDYVSDAQLLKAKVADGKIQMPGGKYNGMVVPDCRFMPLETLKTILSLAKDGAQVVFENQMPADVAGWQDLQQRRAEFASLLSEVSSGSLSNCDCATPFGKGKISVGHVGAFLPFDDDGGVGGDSAVHSGGWDGSSGLSFVRRSFGGGWNYFFDNRSGKNFDGWITLDRPVKSAVILDPMTGKSGVAAFGASALNSTEIRLQLAAGESVIVRAFAGEIAGGGEPLARPVAATRRPYPYFQTNGEPTEISGAWNVQFISGGPTLPADLQISKLESWTKFADTNCQSFAGTAKYAVTFDAPNLKSKIRNLKFFLDLGDVRQSARVRLNGKDYGTLIAPPFRVVVDNLQAGGNKLEIEVTSVAANRIHDLDRRGVNWKIFKDINLVNEDYQPFDASNWPLTDCGLLGPVTLTPLRAE
jgi:hypothetical protein